MLIDLDKFREYSNVISDGIKFLQKHPKCFAIDQDILNYFFVDKYKKLIKDTILMFIV